MRSASKPVNNPKAREAIPWIPPRARICVAPAYLSVYKVAGGILPVFLLVGHAAMMFFTPATRAVPTAMAEVNAPVLDVAFCLHGKFHHLVHHELNIFFVLAWNVLGLLFPLLFGHQGSAGETI